LKDTERRADKWSAAMGVAQTEIDALQPDLLAQIARDAIAPFFDGTLSRRVRAAASQWETAAQQAIDSQGGPQLESRTYTSTPTGSICRTFRSCRPRSWTVISPIRCSTPGGTSPISAAGHGKRA
jgi:hypothetical protein